MGKRFPASEETNKLYLSSTYFQNKKFEPVLRINFKEINKFILLNKVEEDSVDFFFYTLCDNQVEPASCKLAADNLIFPMNKLNSFMEAVSNVSDLRTEREKGALVPVKAFTALMGTFIGVLALNDFRVDHYDSPFKNTKTAKTIGFAISIAMIALPSSWGFWKRKSVEQKLQSIDMQSLIDHAKEDNDSLKSVTLEEFYTEFSSAISSISRKLRLSRSMHGEQIFIIQE